MALTKVSRGLLSTGIVDNSNATAITIDGSLNVMVGKTSFDSTTVGAILRPTGAVVLVADGGDALLLNRKTSDGSIIDFRKDNTTVGSIGTNAATMYVSAPQAGGMKYSYLTSTNAVMLPVTTTGASADGTHDLGLPGGRFRDIYLSGGAYLGGTAAANKLDEFEEGTWSLTSSATITNTIVAQYVRIGRLVTGIVDVILASGQTSSSPLSFNLPLTSDGNYGAGVVNYTNGSLAAQPLTANPDVSSILYIRYSHGNNATIAQFTGARIIFNFTYFTNA
jgi:hypothetical protein